MYKRQLVSSTPGVKDSAPLSHLLYTVIWGMPAQPSCSSTSSVTASCSSRWAVSYTHLLVCTGCSSRPLTDIEPRQDYAAILRQFLPASSQMTILTDPSQDTYGLLELYELTDQLMEQFAITLSPSNNTPYALAIILPAAGQQEPLLEQLQALVAVSYTHLSFPLCSTAPCLWIEQEKGEIEGIVGKF